MVVGVGWAADTCWVCLAEDVAGSAAPAGCFDPVLGIEGPVPLLVDAVALLVDTAPDRAILHDVSGEGSESIASSRTQTQTLAPRARGGEDFSAWGLSNIAARGRDVARGRSTLIC